MNVQQYYRRSQVDNPFISVWNTANTSTGSSGSNQVRLPLLSTGTYNFVVDWGDSTTDTITAWNQAQVTHTYASSGTYTITIKGVIIGWRFDNTGDRLKILNVTEWGSIVFQSSNNINGGSFRGCANFNFSATDTPIIEGPSQDGFFGGCTNLTANPSINSWDLSEITVGLRNFFIGCTNFNQNIGLWNISGADSLQGMFASCTSFNNGGSADINNWNVSNVTNFSSMFSGATSFNQPIGNWNISSAINISSMFNGATSFNQNIGGWDVSNVTTVTGLFNGANAFNNGGSPSINDWNTSNWTGNVVAANQAFFGSAFNQPIGNWDVSGITSFGNNNRGFFQGATSFNQDISSWDVSNVTSFFNCFLGAASFNQDISSWNVSNGTNFASMFQNATAFNQNIGGWNVSKSTTFANFMAGKTFSNYSAANLDAIYNGWSALTFVNTGLTISFGTIRYTSAGAAGRAILTGAPNNWTITDGGI